MQGAGKKKYIFSLSICLSIVCPLIFVVNPKLVLSAPLDPQFYYYSGGRKNALALSKEKVAVRFKGELTLEQQKALVESEQNLGPFSQREVSATFKLTFLALREGLTEEDVIETINTLSGKSEVEGAYPVFDLPDGELVVTDEFNVRFDPNITAAEIDAFNVLNNVEVVRKPQWTQLYTLRVKDPTNMNTLRTANRYHESPTTMFSLPNFHGRSEKLVATTPNDEYFPEQWCLHNTGQTGGTPDADIDAPEGWDISTGSPEIVIAVIDSGVDLGHEDLVNKLVDGYDAFDDDNDPSPGADGGNAHGTACAGLAAAETHNGIGIAGVSWGCKIMPIRAFSKEGGRWEYTNAWFANAITWAANNGADVLSNSWVNPYGDSDDVHNAIIDAKNNGRGGKGCVSVQADLAKWSTVCINDGAGMRSK